MSLPSLEPIAITQIGIIADTHGLLRPQAIAALTGAELILHAGDIGKPEVLAALETLAPVIAVRGNNDQGDWATAIPKQETILISEIKIQMLHILQELATDPEAAGLDVVISGHSHRPLIQERNGVLFINPGSAGPRRFKLPVSVARLQIHDGTVEAQIVALDLS